MAHRRMNLYRINGGKQCYPDKCGEHKYGLCKPDRAPAYKKVCRPQGKPHQHEPEAGNVLIGVDHSVPEHPQQYHGYKS